MEKVRLNRFDNLKGLAILMIVFWHLRSVDLFPELPIKFIFLTALPIFFFVAGRFSKTTPDQPVKIFKRLMVPYLIFTVLFKLFRYVLTGKFTIDMMFLKPETALWFLLALFFMKISLPIVDRFRYPLLTVTAVAVLSGFLNIDSNLLALARFFGYFPIFLLGFYYESYRDSFAERYPKVYGFYEKYFIVFFAVTIIVSLIAISRINTPRICFTSAYEGKIAVEMIKCIIILVLLFLLIPMISRAMTNRETFLTKFGKNSMAVYMLHVFILIALNHYTRTYIIMNPTVTAIVGVVMSFAVTFILSRDIVTKYLNILTDSVANLILKTENV